MQRLVVDAVKPDATIIARAAELLRSGGLVAFPTETVYGLGANALDARAVDRIYAAKGRPSHNPLIVHIANVDQVLRIARKWTDRAELLARAFWPGPLTLVLPRRDEVPAAVSAGLPTVAVRLPSHPVAHALLLAADIPVAAPSANKSTMLSPTTAAHVEKSLGDAVDLILDAGPTPVGIESTVLDLTQVVPMLLRPGSVTIEQIESVIGPIEVGTSVRDGAPRPSPGMMERHYSPRATLLLVASDDVSAAVAAEQRAGRRVGALVRTVPLEESAERMPSDAAGYAARLYGALHELDDAGYDAIVVERVPDTPEWSAVRDRLERAAHH
jgi:L-threonylcarbamoyladenylate synthase